MAIDLNDISSQTSGKMKNWIGWTLVTWLFLLPTSGDEAKTLELFGVF